MTKRNVAAILFAIVSAWIMAIVGQPDLYNKGMFRENTEAVLLYGVVGPMITCAIAEGAWSYLAIPLPTAVMMIAAFVQTLSLHPGQDFFDVMLARSWMGLATLGPLMGGLGCLLGFVLKFAVGVVAGMVSKTARKNEDAPK
ncbi:MAG: hypothetical protein AAB152_16110 [Candidatus Coatesbacteria bacterium]